MRIIISIVFIISCLFANAQSDSNDVSTDTSIDTIAVMQRYEAAYDTIKAMLIDENQLDFKKAVFISENAFFEGAYDYESYCNTISLLVEHLYDLMKQNKWDTANTHIKHTALFNFMTREYWYVSEKEWKHHKPFTYNFQDSEGKTNWKSMCTINLLNNWEGNCYVMPTLAKILALELGAESNLAVAPQHLFLKAQGEGRLSYNMEFTNKTTPFDDAYLAQGFINTNAVRNGVYLVGLSSKEEITLPLLNLAQSARKKFGDAAYNFTIKCANLAIEYSPTTYIIEAHFKGDISTNVNALLLKAETMYGKFESIIHQQGFESHDALIDYYFSDLVNLKKNQTEWKDLSEEDLLKAYPFEKYVEDYFDKPTANILQEMTAAYADVASLGYEEMELELYLDWLDGVKKEALKQNKKFNYISTKKVKK